MGMKVISYALTWYHMHSVALLHLKHQACQGAATEYSQNCSIGCASEHLVFSSLNHIFRSYSAVVFLLKIAFSFAFFHDPYMLHISYGLRLWPPFYLLLSQLSYFVVFIILNFFFCQVPNTIEFADWIGRTKQKKIRLTG